MWLQDTELSPIDLAIDGPSTKMERFLAKNYGIDRLMRQNNNFAVSPRFFDKLSTEPGYDTWTFSYTRDFRLALSTVLDYLTV